MLELVTNNSDVILSPVPGVLPLASLIIAGTKTPDPDTVLGKRYKAVEFLSLTIGKAKETGKPEVKPEEVEVIKGTTEKVD